MALALTSNAGQISKNAQPNKITQRSVPAFLNKLFTMVNDDSTDDLIRWSDDGDSFIVPSADRFGRELLPRFFKHCNFGSFVRQLNMYGFHKVPHIQSGALKNDEGGGAELLEFSNPNFARAQPDLLCLIRRQKAKAEPSAHENQLDLPVLLTDLAAIQKHQKAISADLKDLQVSNHALWQEALASREKHSKQQETINKILRFLATVFGGQVVNDVAESPAASVVEEEQGGLARSSQSATPQPNGGKGGKGKGRSVAVVPKVRSRLLLEDVKRKASNSPSQSRFASEDDDDHSEAEIEEIPLLVEDDSDLPTISSATQYGTRGAMSRSNSAMNTIFDGFPLSSPSKRAGTPTRATLNPSSSSDSNRFTTLPTATSAPLAADPTPASAPYQLQPDMVQSLLHPNNSSSLSAFLAMQDSNNTPGVGSFPNLVGSLAPPPPTTAAPTSISMPDPMTAAFMGMGAGGGTDYQRAILPSLLPPPTAAPGPTEHEMALQHQALRNVAHDKVDIEDRTTALENAIAKLMQNLPEQTRESLQNNGTDFAALLSGPAPPSPAGPSGLTPGASAEGMQWPAQGGESSEVDLDKFLAQYVNTSNSPAPSGGEPVDYSYLFDQPQPNLNGATPRDLNGAAADSPGGDDSFFDEDDVLEDPVWEAAQTPQDTVTPTRGKKRKSDANDLPTIKAEDGEQESSPEGTRKSSRRRKR